MMWKHVHFCFKSFLEEVRIFGIIVISIMHYNIMMTASTIIKMLAELIVQRYSFINLEWKVTFYVINAMINFILSPLWEFIITLATELLCSETPNLINIFFVNLFLVFFTFYSFFFKNFIDFIISFTIAL